MMPLHGHPTCYMFQSIVDITYKKDQHNKGVHPAEHKTMSMAIEIRTKPGVALLSTEASPLTNPQTAEIFPSSYSHRLLITIQANGLQQ